MVHRDCSVHDYIALFLLSFLLASQVEHLKLLSLWYLSRNTMCDPTDPRLLRAGGFIQPFASWQLDAAAAAEALRDDRVTRWKEPEESCPLTTNTALYYYRPTRNYCVQSLKNWSLLVTTDGFTLPNTNLERNISTSLYCSLFTYKNRWLDKIINEVPSDTKQLISVFIVYEQTWDYTFVLSPSINSSLITHIQNSNRVSQFCHPRMFKIAKTSEAYFLPYLCGRAL